ncbi:26S proteasome regulatory complex component [Tanacetum coccineum]
MLIGLSRFRYLLAVFGLDKLQIIVNLFVYLRECVESRLSAYFIAAALVGSFVAVFVLYSSPIMSQPVTNVTYAKVSSMRPISSLPLFIVCGDVDRCVTMSSLGDDNNLPFTMRSSSTPVSWLSSHTESVIVAMVVSGIALPVRPDKLYTGSKDETIRVWDFQARFALALLADYLDKEDPSVKIGAINNGLGLASVGCQNEQIRDKLTPIIGDPKAPLDVIAFTTISLTLGIFSSLKFTSELEALYAWDDS